MKAEKKKRKDKFWIIFVIVVAIAIAVRLFVFEVVFISGDSMNPTLNDGQVILIYKAGYAPTRGDIVVFNDQEGKELVKRVVGLPGETIEITGGIVYIDGEAIDEEYQFSTSESLPATTIPEGSIYVLGDNRNYSTDSRVFGPVELSEIRGKRVLAIY